MTIDALIREAADIQQKATDGRQYSAAIAALIAKAKLAGRWVERTEQNNTNVNYAAKQNGSRSTSPSTEHSAHRVAVCGFPSAPRTSQAIC